MKPFRCLSQLLAVVIVCLLLSSCHTSRRTAVTAQRHLTKTELTTGHPATAKLLAEADSWIGTPYRYAGTDRSGVDCSGLTCKVFEQALAIALPRNSAAQASWCTPVKRGDLIAGDLVFFSSNSSGKNIGHVGIYVGNDRIIHASPSRGVMLASLSGSWFESHYRSAGRVGPYYAMLTSPSKSSQPSKSNQATPQSPAASPADPGPSITLAQYVAAVNGSSGAAVPTPPDSVIAVGRTPPPSAPSTVAAARSKVVSTYRELPPDSVMSSYFD